MTLTAENVTVERGGRAVLSQVSIRLEASGGVAIVGPNGAGKTTLLLALLGLLRTRSGRVTLDGRDVKRISRREIARRIAYVPQSVDGFAGFSVRQVVAGGRFPHRHPLEPLDSQDRRLVDDALAGCGLIDFAERTLDTLSGGERQRVWLAAALAQDAPILLLDEPAASLDPRHQAELIRLARELAGAGRMVVMVAHDLNFAAAVANRIIALRGGIVAFDGATEQFLVGEHLQGVFDTPFVLTRDGVSPRPFVNLAVA